MKKYLLTVALLTSASCALVAWLNYRVDPYGVYHWQHATKETLSRIDQFSHMRITKPWHVDQDRPVAVIVGSSRSGPLPPAHPNWPERSYNLAVPGMTIHEMSRFIEHAQANGPLQELMIGIDFEALVRSEPVIRAGFDEDRMGLPGEQRPRLARRAQRAQDIANTLFSLPAAGLSLAAWSGNGDTGRWYFPDGTWQNRGRFLTGRSGYLYTGRGVIEAHRSGTLQLEPNLERLQGILEFCYRNGIETRLFFTPTHVFLVDLWRRLGYTDLWAESHRAVIEANTALAALHDREPYQVWGFSDESGVVDEPIVQPRQGDTYWYDDGVHFSRRLGGHIMAAVWGGDDEFGTRLDKSTLQPYLERTLALAQRFDRTNQKLTAALRHDISPEL